MLYHKVMPIIGLDLGEHSFRAVELETKKGSRMIQNFGYFENPQLNRNKLKDNKELYISALKQFFSEFGFSTPEVILGLSENNVFMRLITLPKMDDADLKNTIQYEAEQYIPLPLNEVNVSYQKLDTSIDPSKMDIQLVAAKKEHLQQYVEIVRGANLIPRAIEPETLAVTRAILGKGDASGTIILDIGFSSTVVSIIHKGVVYFTRTIPVGGDYITKAIQQKLSLEYLQAEEYKKTYGLDESHFEGKIYEVIKPIIDSIIAETNRAALFFTKENPEVAIKKTILTGGTVLMPSLLVYLVNALGMEVVVGDPLSRFTFAPTLENKKTVLIENANLYTTALGLAMKGI